MDYDEDGGGYGSDDNDMDYDDDASTNDDIDDGIEMEDTDVQGSSTKDGENMDCTVLTTSEIAKEMQQTIDDVAMILGIPPGMCRILLHKFNWDKDRLLERYYENGDSDAFLRQSQVLPPKTRRHSARLSGVAPVSECDVCCVESSDLSGLDCKHLACTHCWQLYLRTKITQDNTSEIQCIASNCKLLVDDARVLNYIKDPAVLASYERLKINSYVEANRLVRWCPGADCGKAIKVNHAEARPTICSCGMRFCFGCAQDWHEPASCKLLKQWLKKLSDDSETSNWINANTKECPKCQVIIEKDGGCNHMTCKNVACRHEFCWMCLGPWEPHGSSWYNCNRFDDSSAKQARDAQEVSRANLQRYLHYYNRYTNHQNSLKLENKLYATVKSTMEHMQSHNMSWIEVQFLRKAVDVLSECRRTLMYTYAFAYYLIKDNNQLIFEDNQKDLEMATEQLSEFLERDLENTSTNLIELKQKVQDKYRYVDQRRRVLLRHCHEGYEKEIWNFSF